MSWQDAHLVLRRGAATRHVSLGECFDPAAAETAAEGAIAWIKAIRHLRVEGQAFRDRFTYRGDSLWWFAELFLHKEDQVARWFGAMAAIRHAVDRDAPEGLAIEGGDDWLQHIGREAARTSGIGWEGAGSSSRSFAAAARQDVRSRFLFWSAYWSRQRAADVPALTSVRRGGVAAFVHGAFWRAAGAGSGEEGYIGPVLRELAADGPGAVQVIGVGPRTNFRARHWWDAATESADTRTPFTPIEHLVPRIRLQASREIWASRRQAYRAMAASDDLRAHARVDGIDLWPLLQPELQGIASLQFPWSARVMDEAGAALDVLEPAALVTYAEAGGWGRALMLEARRRGVPGIGLQHGFIYRHWLNYRHAPDEMTSSTSKPADRGFPRPDLTLLFDAYARQHLESAGSFPPGSLGVTGSPKLDQMAAEVRSLDEAARSRVRASVGAAPTDHLVLVTTKHSQIRRVFRDVVAAAAAVPGVRLVVKCHPAETAEPYERDAGGAAHVTIAPADANLARLVAVAEAVVTVNSTVALDAMSFGVPALVVDLPNNLSPFVDREVMVGARAVADIAPALRTLLEDESARAALKRRQAAFLAEFVPEADGRSSARAAEAIRRLAGSTMSRPD